MLGTIRSMGSALASIVTGSVFLTALDIASISTREWIIQGMSLFGIGVVSLSLRETYRGWKLVQRYNIQGARRIVSLGSMRDAAITLGVHLAILAANTVMILRPTTYEVPLGVSFIVLSGLATVASYARRLDRRAIYNHSARNALTKAIMAEQLTERGIPLPESVKENLAADGLDGQRPTEQEQPGSVD